MSKPSEETTIASRTPVVLVANEPRSQLKVFASALNSGSGPRSGPDAVVPR